MTLIQSQSWEIRLLDWAQEAFDSQKRLETVPADRDLLSAAYQHCTEITRAHSRTFFMASGLLPGKKRLAARALYAFCRITDNIVDEADQDETRLAALAQWQEDLNAPGTDSLVGLAWADTQARFKMPHGYAQQLIEGVRRDMVQTRYATFADLAEYSYGVASTVGLMAMHIIGFSSEAAIPYAIKLGVALQLTNILRDVAEDWRSGRVYLPQDELAEFGLSEADIAAGQVDDRWRSFMRFQIERARQLYTESQPGIAMLNRDGRFAIGAAAGLYEAILSEIEMLDYNVFETRAHVNALSKLSLLPGIWWRSKKNSIA